MYCTTWEVDCFSLLLFKYYCSERKKMICIWGELSGMLKFPSAPVLDQYYWAYSLMTYRGCVNQQKSIYCLLMQNMAMSLKGFWQKAKNETISYLILETLGLWLPLAFTLNNIGQIGNFLQEVSTICNKWSKPHTHIIVLWIQHL